MGSQPIAPKDDVRAPNASLAVRDTRAGKTLEVLVTAPLSFPSDAPGSPTEDENVSEAPTPEDGSETSLDVVEAADALTQAFTAYRDPDRIPMSRSFGKIVMEKRKAEGWNRMDVARMAEVPRDFIKVIETRGVKTSSRRQVEAVMRVLDISEYPQVDEIPELVLWWEAPVKATVKLRQSHRHLLRKHRNALKLTLANVGDQIGEPSSSLQLIEYEHGPGCNSLTLAKFATVLRVTPGTSLGRQLRSLGFTWLRVVEGYSGKKRGPKHVDWGHVGLGKKSDCALAEELGMSIGAVQRARVARKIPVYKGPKRANRKTPPAYTAAQLFEELGEPPIEDSRVGWLKVPLGCTTDKAIAGWLGVSRERVSGIRRRYRTAPYVRVKWDLLPLGEVPDTVIATWVSVTTACVATTRKSRGIAPAPVTSRRDHAGVYAQTGDPKYLTPRELKFPTTELMPWPRKKNSKTYAAPGTPSKVMDPPAQKGTNLWDYVEEVIGFLETVAEVRPENVLYFLGMRKAKKRMGNARELFTDLEWRELPDGRWVPPNTVVAIPEPEETPDLLAVLQEGLWSVPQVAKKIGLSSPKAREQLEDLVANNLIQRVGAGPAIRYFASPT